MSVRAKTRVVWAAATAVVIGIVWIRTIAPDSIEALGDTLTGIAALLAVAVASIQFESWQDRKRQERDAEIAGRALVAAVTLKDCLLAVSRAELDDVFAAEDSSSGDIEFAEALQSWLWKPEVVTPFKEAWVQVQAYLPDSLSEAMACLWSLRTEMDNLVSTARHQCGPNGESRPASHAAWRSLRGDELRQRIDAAYSSLKRGLRPLALAQP